MISRTATIWVLLVPAAYLLIYAALHDIAARTVPNWLCAGILILGVSIRTIDGTLIVGLSIASAIFICLACIWCLGAIGGGDVKLWAASVVLIPPHWQLELAFFLHVLLAGGALGVVYIALRFALPRPRASLTGGLIKRILRVEAWRISRFGPLPYAVAIATGAVLTLMPISILALR